MGAVKNGEVEKIFITYLIKFLEIKVRIKTINKNIWNFKG